MGKYTVKKGDSWASIAGKLYGGDQRFYNVLMAANSGINMLQPGMVIDAPNLDSYRRNLREEGKLHYVGPDDVARANLYTYRSGGTNQIAFQEGTAPSPWYEYLLTQAGLTPSSYLATAPGGAGSPQIDNGGYPQVTRTPYTELDVGSEVPLSEGLNEPDDTTRVVPGEPRPPTPRSPRATDSRYTRNAATEGGLNLTWQARRAAGMSFNPTTAGYNVSSNLRRLTAEGTPTSIYDYRNRGLYSGQTRNLPTRKTGSLGGYLTPPYNYPYADYTNYGGYDVVRDVRRASDFEPGVTRQSAQKRQFPSMFSGGFTNAEDAWRAQQDPLGVGVPTFGARSDSRWAGSGPRERNTRGTGRRTGLEQGLLQPDAKPGDMSFQEALDYIDQVYRELAEEAGIPDSSMISGVKRDASGNPIFRDGRPVYEYRRLGSITTKRVEGYAPIMGTDRNGNPKVIGWEPIYSDTPIEVPLRSGPFKPSEYLIPQRDGSVIISGGDYPLLALQPTPMSPPSSGRRVPVNGVGNYRPFEWSPTRNYGGGGKRTTYNRPYVRQEPSGPRVSPAGQYQRPVSRGGLSNMPQSRPINQRGVNYRAFIGATNWRLF